MKTKKIILLVLRVLIGAMFITTAIMKLITIDQFELYIYSFGIFNFFFVSVLSRLLIAFEFIMGAFLITKSFYKYTWWLIMLMMIAFTLFLGYVALFRNDSNCHCFGDIIQVNPLMSIVKNVITIILLLFIRKEDDYVFKGKKWLNGSLIAIAVIVPFAVFPMDSLYNKIVSPKSNVNEKAYREMLADSSLTDLDIDDGNYVVAVVAAGCKYCKMSGTKIEYIISRDQLDPQHFIFLIWGDEDRIEQFKEETGTYACRFFNISPVLAINTVYGAFPTFIMVEKGVVKSSFDYRGINEAELIRFLPAAQE